SGPREGMNETGSVLAIITRPLPSLKTEQSIPDLGPWTTSEFQAPVCRKTVCAKTRRCGFPRIIEGTPYRTC
ncbi:MAG TPA: hypothetical protein VIH83_00185, partial [Candidatus Bathyarchaeia archaeon]